MKEGFKFVKYGGNREDRKDAWAVRCKRCGTDVTFYCSTKEEAEEEYERRGHSESTCEMLKRDFKKYY